MESQQQEEYSSSNLDGNRQRNFNHPYKRQNYFQQNRGMDRFGSFSQQNHNNSPRYQNYRNGNGHGGYNRNFQLNRNYNYNNSARNFTPHKVRIKKKR